MLATIPSGVLVGVDAVPVSVEVHVSAGLPGFTIVGLPDASCRESRDRVRAALLSSGLAWPQKRTTVNLAPSNVRKSGTGLDLAVAVGVLVASGDVPRDAVEGWAFFGELGLDGSLRPVPGTLGLVAAAPVDRVVVPPANLAEARLAGRGDVRSVRTLRELVDILRGEPWPPPPPVPPSQPPPPPPDLADVRSQRLGRWAVEVAAAGGHHLLLVGPPGSGKTMLATRLPGVLPVLDRGAALQVTQIHSAAGQPLPPGVLIDRPPFRAPHHSTSAPALVGGGTGALRPGEVTLAHHGCLFIDELGEVPGYVLDQLRQPLEEGVVRIQRASARATFPCRFQLVAAMNPCPCGDGGPVGTCRCTPQARARYDRRLSGPLLDRFDLRIEVRRPEVDELLADAPSESTEAVAARVRAVRARAAERGVPTNARLTGEALQAATRLSPEARALVEWQLRTGRLTARGLDRIRRVARTVADLAGADEVLEEIHVASALELRADVRPALVFT